MVDSTPSDMDDLFNFGGPSNSHVESSSPIDVSAVVEPVETYPSRREALRAETPAEFPTRRDARPEPSAARLPKRRQKGMARAASNRRELSRASSDRHAVARAARDLGVEPGSRKLSRRELAAMHSAAPKAPRKHPLSVLATMTVVGGIFAVAGLPAYALTATNGDNKADVAAQSMVVSSDAVSAADLRDTFRATTPQQLAEMTRDDIRAQNNAEYLVSGARELGDDYPWPYELSDSQGGGLSPLNYYYRECVDFVAWRLNRDQGSYAEPYKWVWSTLTPLGGNASQWESNWASRGWPESKTPIVGSVAWFGYSNHVAYVKAVNADGTILLEEYNYNYSHKYGQRVIPASSVEAFLYPPS